MYAYPTCVYFLSNRQRGGVVSSRAREKEMDTPSTPAKNSDQQPNLPTLSPGTQEFLKRHNLDQRLLDSDDSDDDDSFDPALLASASRNALANSKIGGVGDSGVGVGSSSSTTGNTTSAKKELKDLTNRPTANLPRRATPPDFKRSSPLSGSLKGETKVRLRLILYEYNTKAHITDTSQFTHSHARRHAIESTSLTAPARNAQYTIRFNDTKPPHCHLYRTSTATSCRHAATGQEVDARHDPDAAGRRYQWARRGL